MKLNEQFEVYSDSQQKMLKDTAVQFAEEFRNAFVGGFTQFEKNLEKTNDMQTQYMTFLDHTMQDLSRNIGGQQASIDNYILKSAGQQETNMKDVQALLKKMTTSVNSFSKASTGYQDAVTAVTDRLSGNEYALMQGIQSFMDAISGLAGELQEKSGRDYSEVLASLQAVTANGMEQICQSLKEEQRLLEKERSLLQSGEQPRIEQDTDQSEVLNEILIQMRELVELEKKRERRGLRRLFSGKSR